MFMSRSSKIIPLPQVSPPLPPRKKPYLQLSFSRIRFTCPASLILLLLLIIVKVLTLLLDKFQRHNAHAEFRKNRSAILYVEVKGHTEGVISKACFF
jgi:hypothetical protein